MSENQEESALFQMLLNTLQELWIVKDRQIVLEDVLKAHGIDVTEAIERLQPNEALQSQLDAERKRLLQKILEPIQGQARS